MFDPAIPFDPANDVMRHYLNQGINAEYVSLQHYGISDLVPYVAQLSLLRNMKTLNVAHNKITRLPEDLSSLEKLENLDLSHNPIASAAAVIRGLFSLKKLRHLKVTLPEDEEDQIVAALGHLSTLNGITLDVEARGGATEERTDSSQALLQSVRRGTGVAVPRGYTVIETSAREKLDFKPWTGEDVDAAFALHASVAQVSRDMSHPDEHADYVHLINSHLRSKTKGDSDYIKQSMHQFNAKSLLLEYSFDELVRASARFGPELAHALESIYNYHLALVAQASTVMAVMQEDKERVVSALQEDLAKELLIKERMNAASAGNTDYADDQFRSHRHQTGAEPSRISDEATARQGLGSDKQLMSISELRALIKLLMDSKKKHDSANFDARLPPETLEQHIYSFLFVRTKNDEEIKKRVTTIFKSVKHHSRSELDIEIFSLILKHEVEESFWERFEAQKSSTYDAIHSTILASDGFQTRGEALDGFVTEDQAKAVVDILVPHSHSERHIQLTRAVVRALSRSEAAEDSYHISYKDLGGVILRYFLSVHLTAIRPFAIQFRRLDSERTGVIEAQQFRTLLNNIFPGLPPLAAQDLFAAADPFRNNLITFSQYITVLHNYIQSQIQSREDPATPPPGAQATPPSVPSKKTSRKVSAAPSGVASPRIPSGASSVRGDND
jgi:hypothetical protein